MRIQSNANRWRASSMTFRRTTRSTMGKKRSRKNNAKVHSPAHDDLVRRQFSAEAPNQLWLSNLTEHRTGEGKLYLCAIKDCFSNRIVGYIAVVSRVESPLRPTMIAAVVRS